MPGAARKLVVEKGDDPVLAAFLRAPMDDRPETDEERAAVEAAKADFQANGRGVPHAEVIAAIECSRDPRSARHAASGRRRAAG
jgi:hypothetical protein